MSAQVLQFPTTPARIAARKVGATDDELDAMAASIEEIVAEIHRIIAADNAQRNQIMQEWK